MVVEKYWSQSQHFYLVVAALVDAVYHPTILAQPEFVDCINKVLYLFS